MASDLDDAAGWWDLDPSVTFLNHGSFGACPRPVLAEQSRLRAEMERQPVDFLDRRLDGLLEAARISVAAFLGADPDGLAFMANTTTAASTVIRALNLQPGDQIVVSDQTYGAVGNAVARACRDAGGEIVVVAIPLPLPDDAALVDAFVAAIGPQTRLVVIDSVSSPTGAILPAEAVARACRERGVDCFIDGAHGPGMIPVDLSSSAATYWAGNLHKWVSAPKGSAVLYADDEARRELRPLVTSHPYLVGFHDRFGWTGTYDPTPYLAAPSAIDLFAGLGWDRVMQRNAALAEQGRAVVAAAVDGEQLVEPDRAAAMTLVPLPSVADPDRTTMRAAQRRFYDETGIEVPFVGWSGRAYLRLSAQLYNTIDDYERLAQVLPAFVASVLL